MNGAKVNTNTPILAPLQAHTLTEQDWHDSCDVLVIGWGAAGEPGRGRAWARLAGDALVGVGLSVTMVTTSRLVRDHCGRTVGLLCFHKKALRSRGDRRARVDGLRQTRLETTRTCATGQPSPAPVCRVNRETDWSHHPVG